MTRRIGSFIEVGTARGRPLEVGGRRLVPVAQTLIVRLSRPGGPMAGLLTWTRPIAVEVSEAEGTKHIAIPDVTRRIVFGLVAVAMLLVLAKTLRGAQLGKG